MKKTVIELFAGVGGFRVGLNDVKGFNNAGRAIENRDWDFVWANQWEPSAKCQPAFNCYKKRFGDEEHLSNQDIADVDKNVIPEHNLIVSGFPCQDYSIARVRAGEQGIEGKKGVLFWEIVKVLKLRKTPFVLLENVDRILRAPARQRGRDFGIILRTFHDLGYNVEWRILNAADYGAAQRRRRAFIFAWKRDTNYNESIPCSELADWLSGGSFFSRSFPVQEAPVLKEIDILGYEDTADMTDRFKASFENAGVLLDGQVFTGDVEPVCVEPIVLRQIREDAVDLSKHFLTERQEKRFEYRKGYKKKPPRLKPDGTVYRYTEGAISYPDDLDLPGRTVLTSEGTVNRCTHVIEDKKTGRKRFLTPIEMERLQSFPDNWTDTGMSMSQRYFVMGNALVTKLINDMEAVLSDIFEKED